MFPILEFASLVLMPLLIAILAFVVYYSIAEGVEYTNMVLTKYKGIIGILAITAAIITALGQIATAIKPLSDLKSFFQNTTHHNNNNNEVNQPYSTAFLDKDNNIVIQMGIYKPLSWQCIISGYEKGAYKIDSVEGAADIVNKIIKDVNTLLYKNTEHCRVDISILGVEDASTIKHGSKYNDTEWGHIAIPYYNLYAPDSLCVKHFIPDVTYFTEGDFAILRAYGLYRELRKIKHPNIKMYSEISNNKGKNDRCVIFNIVISGVINNRYEELNNFQKIIFNNYIKHFWPQDYIFEHFNDSIKAIPDKTKVQI